MVPGISHRPVVRATRPGRRARGPGEPALQETVLAWFERTRRDLPWRATRDPWAVLVSELMLQQTQVARVLPRYTAFLDRFPDAASCAAAGPGAVVESWAGLGYNRRAVYLHRAAQAVVERHGGALPDRLDQLTALPGIGPYTAAAPSWPSPSNSTTGWWRPTSPACWPGPIYGRRLTAGPAQECADRLVPEGKAWAWNQAMVDLGATVCVSRAPRCDRCPLAGAGLCAWFAPGPAAAGSGPRVSGYLGAAERVRRLRPPRAGSPGRRLAPRTGPPGPGGGAGRLAR